VLDKFARNTHFTAMGFEALGEQAERSVTKMVTPVKVYVGTMTGLLYQVDYHTRELDAIYRIHDSAICTISTSPGFCVTGSQDQFLRVWPLDFSEFFFDAKHEGIVVSLDISRDGLKVACGTSNGGLGIIDLQN